MIEALKTIGPSGQISLGKEYAGRHVLIQKSEPGVWTIKVGAFIPDNEAWLHEPKSKKALHQALEWADKNPPKETDLKALEKKLKSPHGS
ncbi:MAG: hypothetical protein KDK66_02780 [Deltaproteobacteria bacterium]|nr:hypothetical protein [Deltaproteobacteria bacterium]